MKEIIPLISIPFLQPSFELDSSFYNEYWRVNPYNQIPILYYQFNILKNAPNTIAAVPDGCLDIIFCCNDFKPTVYVYGSVLTSELVPFKNNEKYFGVRIPPGYGFNSKHVSIKEFINNRILLEDFYPDVENIVEVIVKDQVFKNKINIFESTIGRSITNNAEDHQLIDYLQKQIILSSGNMTIKQLAHDTGYSSRYLRDKFDQNIGISPKKFSTIIRFQRSLNMLINGYCVEDIIFKNGYYDQAHLINDFRNFGYISPLQFTTYLKKQMTRKNK